MGSAGVCGTQWRGVGRSDYQMTGVGHGGHRPGIATPKNKGRRLLRYLAKHLGCEVLPADFAMTARLACRDCKHGIQQQYALPCKMAQIAGLGCGAQIIAHFAVNVGQRSWQGGHIRFDGKRKAMGMTGCRVGILAKNYRANVAGPG